MTNTEIKARIEELERRRFYLSMKDRWTMDDYDTDRKLNAEIIRLNKELAA